MGFTNDLNRPAFDGTAIDADLDQLRDNWHWILAVAAQGSLVLPGWQTTVQGDDKSQPDSITLTRGTKKIIIYYTWTDESVSAIQFCYDNGVGETSPSVTCYPAISFFYDESGNPVGTVDPDASAFEAAALALNPLAMYTFRDSDFSAQISDVSGNGHHLLKQVATMSRGSALRSTHPGPGYIPATAQVDWATQGIYYEAASGYLDSAISGATAATLLMGFKAVSYSGAARIFSIATAQNGLLGGTTDFFGFVNDASGLLEGRMRGSGGSYLWESAVTGDVFDSAARIADFRIDASANSLILGDSSSDTTEETDGFNRTFDTLTRATVFGGAVAVAGGRNSELYVDFIAVWDSFLTDAQITSLNALYRAEMV